MSKKKNELPPHVIEALKTAGSLGGSERARRMSEKAKKEHSQRMHEAKRLKREQREKDTE